MSCRQPVRHWLSVGQEVRANQVASVAWQSGSRDPVIAEAYAASLAAGGREADLRAALRVCATALTDGTVNTDEAWSGLRTRSSLYAGRLDRLNVLYSDTFDDDGQPIPVRRHHPAMPKRSRAPRFLRD